MVYGPAYFSNFQNGIATSISNMTLNWPKQGLGLSTSDSMAYESLIYAAGQCNKKYDWGQHLGTGKMHRRCYCIVTGTLECWYHTSDIRLKSITIFGRVGCNLRDLDIVK
jgi:hypothetical protein